MCPPDPHSRRSSRKWAHDVPEREAALGSDDRSDTWLNFEPDERWHLLRKVATLELQYGRDLQRAKIADILGVTIDTVKEHRERGLRHLRRLVGRDEEESHGE
jgi:hypothetical protein